MFLIIKYIKHSMLNPPVSFSALSFFLTKSAVEKVFMLVSFRKSGKGGESGKSGKCGKSAKFAKVAKSAKVEKVAQ